MLSEFKQKLKGKIWRYIKDLFHNEIESEPGLIQNINFDPARAQKTILISYLTHGYFVDFRKYSGRTVLLEIAAIIKIFSQLDYCIDLINCNDIKAIDPIKQKKYDLIFGFGEVFYQMSQIRPEAKTLLYLTEQHPEFSYREEKKRLDYFYERHHKTLPIVRSGVFYKTIHLQRKYTNVITLSEVEPLLEQYNRPYVLFPTGIFNTKAEIENKNHHTARKNFLWLGSTGFVHKGLDLLIDVFQTRTDINLHICGLHESDRKLMTTPKRDNIFDHGHVDIASERFIKIISSCSYSVLPSCSEGFSTSITTSMLHGLIPVVMKDTGFNRLHDKAILLNDYKIEYLDNVLTELSEISPESIKVLSKKNYDFAHQEFKISAFEKKFQNIIEDFMKQTDENSTYSKASAHIG